ncbi:MAG: DUF2935 domain-containing protein [Clostridia bacterium]|nr:DUF2935 domain-containing protein [Clostridia bacterium]
MEKYIKSSLELHLFFGRIMKEHAIFLQAGFMPKNTDYSKEAEWYQREFEKLLCDAVKVSNCLVCPEVLNSEELVTGYTYQAERKTQDLTGILIDSNITLLEKRLTSNCYMYITRDIQQTVCHLNNAALSLLDGFIRFKERILSNVLSCNLFTANYPLLIEHIIREAKLYRYYVAMLQNGQDITCEDKKEVELFWNQIMMEHALFIRGLLDPTEEDLIATSNEFAEEYKKLLEEARQMTDETIKSVTDKTILETTKYRDFKEAGTKGINECDIRSIILPLLADHVLREANHYLRILKE